MADEKDDTTQNQEEKVEEPKVEEKEEKEEESSDEEEKEEESSEDDVNIEEAKNLYRLLKNPQTAEVTIRALADGLNLRTKKDREEAKDEIVEALKESLGDYEFLAAKFAPGIKKILEKQAEELEKRFSDLKKEQVENQLDEAIRLINKDTKGDFNKHQKRVAELTGEIPIGTQKPKTYLWRLYKIAKVEADEKAGKVTAIKKANEANADPFKRLVSASGAQGSAIKTGEKLSLDDAIRNAERLIQRR